MQNSQFAPYEYLDSKILNALSAAVSGNVDSIGAALSSPGLIHAGLATLAASGLTVTATMPAPFAVMFGSGVLGFAHGVLAGQDSQTASISLSGLVPSSGAAVTAYLSLASGTVQQSPYQVTGPQPGHPDYNPAFIATTAYALLTDTLILQASLTPPDGVNSVLLAATSLVSGQSSLGALITSGQVLAAPLPVQNSIAISANKTLASGDAGTLQKVVSGVTLTLPDVSVKALVFPFACRASGGFTLQTSSSGQFIHGFGGAPITSASIGLDQAGAIFSTGESWQVLYLNQSSSIVQPSSGGTGLTSLTSGAVLIGNGSGAISLVGPPVSGAILIGTGSSGSAFVSPGTALFKNATNAALSLLASISGSTIDNNVAVFNDTSGTLTNGFAISFAAIRVTAGPTINFGAVFGNIASATYSGTTLTVNFATPMSDANYCLLAYSTGTTATPINLTETTTQMTFQVSNSIPFNVYILVLGE